MGSLSVHVCEDSIVIADEEKAIGRLLKKTLHPVGLDAFLKTNYNLQGSVNYQSWLSGVLAGAVLIFGPPALPSEDQTEAATAGPDPELLPGEIVVPGHTVIDGQVVQSKELQTVAGSDVGTVESVLGDLTASRSPEPAGAPEPTAATVESPQAVSEPAAAPEASGAALP